MVWACDSPSRRDWTAHVKKAKKVNSHAHIFLSTRNDDSPGGGRSLGVCVGAGGIDPWLEPLLAPSICFIFREGYLFLQFGQRLPAALPIGKLLCAWTIIAQGASDGVSILGYDTIVRTLKNCDWESLPDNAVSVSPKWSCEPNTSPEEVLRRLTDEVRRAASSYTVDVPTETGPLAADRSVRARSGLSAWKAHHEHGHDRLRP